MTHRPLGRAVPFPCGAAQKSRHLRPTRRHGRRRGVVYLHSNTHPHPCYLGHPTCPTRPTDCQDALSPSPAARPAGPGSGALPGGTGDPVPTPNRSEMGFSVLATVAARRAKSCLEGPVTWGSAKSMPMATPARPLLANIIWRPGRAWEHVPHAWIKKTNFRYHFLDKCYYHFFKECYLTRVVPIFLEYCILLDEFYTAPASNKYVFSQIYRPIATGQPHR